MHSDEHPSAWKGKGKVKIIAKVSDTRWLVEANNYELANVMGFGYPIELKGNNELIVGREITLSKLWEALSITRGRKKDVAAIAESLRKLAGRIDSINQTLAAPIIEVKE